MATENRTVAYKQSVYSKWWICHNKINWYYVYVQCTSTYIQCFFCEVRLCAIYPWCHLSQCPYDSHADMLPGWPCCTHTTNYVASGSPPATGGRCAWLASNSQQQAESRPPSLAVLQRTLVPAQKHQPDPKSDVLVGRFRPLPLVHFPFLPCGCNTWIRSHLL